MEIPSTYLVSSSHICSDGKSITKTARRAQGNNFVIKYSRKRKGKQDKPLPQRFVAKAVIKKNEKLKRLRMEPKIISHDASFEKKSDFSKKDLYFQFSNVCPSKKYFSKVLDKLFSMCIFNASKEALSHYFKLILMI